METRNFRLDYVAISRVGTMSTVVQRRLSNNFNGDRHDRTPSD